MDTLDTIETKIRQATGEIPLSLESFRQAARRIKGVVRHTDLVRADVFSQETDTEMYLKLENLQRTGSFKFRGAYNKMVQLAQLPPEEKPRGIIAASAGNHAQGVASAGAVAGFSVIVVMPQGASLTKMRACREMGAEVIQYGATLEEAAVWAKNQATERDLLFVILTTIGKLLKGRGRWVLNCWKICQMWKQWSCLWEGVVC